eukprot:Filipodium_phascolosomae@DN2383_c0_g1_i7.p1
MLKRGWQRLAILDGPSRISDRSTTDANLLVPNIHNWMNGHYGLCGHRSLCGTLAYVAPEMLRCDPQSESVNVWSLGVLLHMLLQGGHHSQEATTLKSSTTYSQQDSTCMQSGNCYKEYSTRIQRRHSRKIPDCIL